MRAFGSCSNDRRLVIWILALSSIAEALPLAGAESGVMFVFAGTPWVVEF